MHTPVEVQLYLWTGDSSLS